MIEASQVQLNTFQAFGNCNHRHAHYYIKITKCTSGAEEECTEGIVSALFLLKDTLSKSLSGHFGKISVL